MKLKGETRFIISGLLSWAVLIIAPCLIVIGCTQMPATDGKPIEDRFTLSAQQEGSEINVMVIRDKRTGHEYLVVRGTKSIAVVELEPK